MLPSSPSQTRMCRFPASGSSRESFAHGGVATIRDSSAKKGVSRGVNLLGLGGLQMFQGNFRLNHAAPPFDDPAVRRVLWKLVDQRAMLQAIGVPARYAVADCTSFWMCGSSLETQVG